jgi:hypothetical protein
MAKYKARTIRQNCIAELGCNRHAIVNMSSVWELIQHLSLQLFDTPVNLDRMRLAPVLSLEHRRNLPGATALI